AYSSAGFTAILAWIIFKEKLGLPKIIAIILSLGGCILVSNAYSADIWKLNLLGVTTGLLSGIFFAVYTLAGKETARLNINSWTAMLYSFGFGTIFILVFNLFPFIPGAAGSIPGLLPHLPWDGWACLVFLSFIPTIFGFGLYNMSMYYIPASIANLLATTEPVMTAIEAYFLLNQGMSLIQIIGSAIILSAVIIVQLQKE
ncbi:MAG: EamA family transporter, partial [Chloroflexota bacterium]